MGKFMNGYALGNYHIPPPGWDWTDILVSRDSFPSTAFSTFAAVTHNSIGPTLHLRLQQRSNVPKRRKTTALQILPSNRRPPNQSVSTARPHKALQGPQPDIIEDKSKTITKSTV